MLECIGVSSISDLFSQIPDAIRLQRPLRLPPALSEWELQKRLRQHASKNATVLDCLSFLGAGAYEHYIPAVVPALASRGEFLTAYTPYQPEMSQGLLQVLFEFQNLMGGILGLPIVNCSVYDGATALAESAWMACSAKSLKRIVAAESIWPDWRAVLSTYMDGRGVEIISVPSHPKTGALDLEKLELALSSPSAACLVQSPNSFGVIEDVETVCKIARRRNALSVIAANPISLGCLKSPGELGATIACCEAQPLGIPLSAGGPYIGVIATHPEFKKFLPGRIVGMCKDLNEEPALALVDEEREQHVSRDQAASHICSNQALMALRIVLWLSSVGETGFTEIARLNARKARYFHRLLCSIPGVTSARSGEFFNEFAVRLPCEVTPALAALRERGIFGGVNPASLNPAWPEALLVAVTETKSKEDLDRAHQAFSEVIASLPLKPQAD
jgi:glycine dehydrogenase subunit 1